MEKDECKDGNNRTECLGNNKYEGYCIDLLDVCKKKNFFFKYL